MARFGRIVSWSLRPLSGCPHRRRKEWWVPCLWWKRLLQRRLWQLRSNVQTSTVTPEPTWTWQGSRFRQRVGHALRTSYWTPRTQKCQPSFHSPLISCFLCASSSSTSQKNHGSLAYDMLWHSQWLWIDKEPVNIIVDASKTCVTEGHNLAFRVTVVTGQIIFFDSTNGVTV